MSETFVKRTTLIVEDVARSIAFYRDVVGMKLYYDQLMSVGGKIIPAGKPGAKVRLGIMEGNHADVAKIGLLQWIDPPLERPAAPYRSRMGIGDIVIVTETPDINSLYDRLAKSPLCRIHCPPHEWSVPTPDGKGRIELTTLSFFDPDGFFFEVNHKRNAPNIDRFGIRRTTLIVRDIDRSVDFYRRVMGMEMWYDQTMTVGGQVLPAGTPGAKVRVAILKGADPAVGMFGLMAFLDPPIEHPPLPKRPLAIRDAIVVAHANDVNTIHARMAGEYCHVCSPPIDDTVTAADGSTLKLTTMSFFDPDGYFFELNTRRKVS
ncbi:MAG: VOC family protein [Alphaproteobacteria bacterium]|nr:VOC family protein [Alphaproteobacteria bacterium]